MTAPRPVLDLKLLEPGAEQAEPRGGRARPPLHLADLDADARRARAAELGVPAFRIDQVARHYFSRLTDPGDPSAMTDLPAAGRDDLVWALLPPLLDPVREVTCDEGKTRKTLWRLHDGALVESVLMSYPGRATVCVSSQAGCGMACPFCATGQGGLTRNLSTAEIVDQVVAAARACAHGALGSEDGSVGKDAVPQQLSNVVFMGMGEPLANYPRVVAALRQLVAKPPAGLGLSRRGITVSTVGLVPGIEKLTREDLPVTLALSLHAPDDELRNTLVPVNTRWPVAEVLAAAGRYGTVTGRRVSIEYALMRDINDQRERAALLADALREHFDGGRLVHVNLIPLNPTPGSPWTASEPGVQEAFVSVLRGGGIATTVRDTRGREIDGACGQLAAAE